MEEINPLKRAEELIHDLQLELQAIKIDNKIEKNLQTELEENQKEFILREKLREIESVFK